MPRITATWNPHRYSEAKITYSDFEGISRIAALDFLSDAISELQEKYEAVIEKRGEYADASIFKQAKD